MICLLLQWKYWLKDDIYLTGLADPKFTQTVKEVGNYIKIEDI